KRPARSVPERGGLQPQTGSLTTSGPSAPERGWLRAVTIVDWATFALIVVAICALAFGGFRTQIAGVPVSVKGWQRPALLACVLAAIRHWYLPAPTMPRVWADRGVAIWRTAVGREVAPVFLATRLAVVLAGYMAVMTIGLPAGIERARVFDNRLEDLV